MAGWLNTFSRARAVHINETNYFGLRGFFTMLYNEPWLTQRAARYAGRFFIVQFPLTFLYWAKFTPDNRKMWIERDIQKRREKFTARAGEI